MSRGSKIVPVRIPPADYLALLESIGLVRPGRNGTRESVGEFIRKAIRERIGHLKRSRKAKKQTEHLHKYEFRTLAGETIMCITLADDYAANDFAQTLENCDHWLKLL